jgi:hypothetical protein
MFTVSMATAAILKILRPDDTKNRKRMVADKIGKISMFSDFNEN